MSDSDMANSPEPIKDPESNNPYGKTALINAATLGAFAIVAALLLGTIYVGTKDRIEASRILAEQQALLAVVGDYPHDNNMLDDTLALTESEQTLLNESDASQIYVIRNESQIAGFIFPAIAPDGYSGNVSMLIGIDTNGVLLGARVVEHKETPGLGDKIDEKKSDWILEFAGKSLSNPSIERWGVTKDGGEFDGFTGATITPRATVARVRTVLEYFQQAREDLIERALYAKPVSTNDAGDN